MLHGLRLLVLTGGLLGGCTPAGSRRNSDGGSKAEPSRSATLERAVIDYLSRSIERARHDRGAKARLPAACPSPLVDWESLQLGEVHAFATLGIGDALLTATARPRPKGPPDERTCSAKVAFRFREEATDLTKPKVRGVWLSDQPEPVSFNDEEDEQEEQ